MTRMLSADSGALNWDGAASARRFLGESRRELISIARLKSSEADARSPRAIFACACLKNLWAESGVWAAAWMQSRTSAPLVTRMGYLRMTQPPFENESALGRTTA